MIVTDQPIQKIQPNVKKCEAVLAIHGGAGGTLPPHIPPELDRAYRGALRRSLVKGYEVLSGGSNALDAVCRSVQEMEDDPLFNAAKGAVFTTAGTIECEASVMSALRPSHTDQHRKQRKRRCASAILVRNTKNPILLAKVLFENSRDNPHVILSGRTAEDLGWKQGLERVDSSYYYTRRRWLEHRRDLGLPDDDNDTPPGSNRHRSNSIDSMEPPPTYSARSCNTDDTPSLSMDGSASDEKDERTEADTPSNQSMQEEDAGMQHLIDWEISFDTRIDDQRRSDVASRDSASFEALPLPESSTSLRRATTPLTESLPTGTVGAVAIDEHGNLAVATSTGGITNKLPGRVGDTPIPGAGFYAEYWKEYQAQSSIIRKQLSRSREVEKGEKPNKVSTWSPCEWIRWIFGSIVDRQEQQDEEDAIDQASNLTNLSDEKGTSDTSTIQHRGVAISGTGTGDFFLRTSFASLLAHRMRFLGEDVGTAGRRAVSELGEAGGVGGAICIDDRGRVAFPMNSSTMNRGYIQHNGRPLVAIYSGEKCR